MQVDGKTVEPTLGKPFLLLACLAYEATWVARGKLALLFWPDADEVAAKRNLRQLLSRARLIPFASSIESDPSRLRWRVESDVKRFREAVARQDWQNAAVAYRGDLLEGVPLQGADGFDAWLELEREALRTAFRNSVLQYSNELEAQGQYERATSTLLRLLGRDELAEDVLQSYLRNAYLAGQRDAALGAYERFVRKLDRELGLMPLEETKALADRIRRAAPVESIAPTAAHAPAVPVTVLRPPRTVGREDALLQLGSADTPVILITGEAGVGKTRLLSELAPHAVTIEGLEGLHNIPYYPVAGLVRRWIEAGGPVSVLGTYVEDLARLVPEVDASVTPRVVEPQVAKSRLLEALARFLETRAKTESRFPLVVDDLQWVDAATLELLIFIARRHKLRILGAYRDHELNKPLTDMLAGLQGAQAVTVVGLKPLAPEAVRALMADLTDNEDGPPIFSRWIHDRTGGNPMFILQVLKALFERDWLRASEHGWHTNIDDLTRDYSELEVPPAIAELIQRRIGRLNSDTIRVLQAAAIFGQDFTPLLLAEVSDLSEWSVLDALEETEAAGVIEGASFRHDLLRQAVHQMLPETRRKLLHAKVAEALDGTAEPTVVAEHWLAAGRPERAIYAWLGVAGDLRRKGLHDEALGVLERAERVSPTEELRAEVVLNLLYAHDELGRYQDVCRYLEALAGCAANPRVQALALDVQARLELQQGHIDRAGRTLDQALDVARGLEDDEVTFQLAMARATVAHAAGKYQEALEYLEPELGNLRARGVSLELARTLTSVGVLHDKIGQSERALELHLEALAVARRLDVAYVQVDAAGNLLACLMELERTEEGLAVAENALSLGRFDGTPYLRQKLAHAYLKLDRKVEAVRQFEDVTQHSIDPTLVGVAWARLAELYDESGRTEDVEAALGNALAAVDETEFASAKARVIINVMRFGSAEQVRRASSMLEQVDVASLPEHDRKELERIVATHLV